MQKFKFVSASELGQWRSSDQGSIDWLIEGLIERDTVGVLFGDHGSYKSFVAIDLALHTAAGVAWNGKPVTQGPVIYIAGDGHRGLARRQAAWLVAHGVPAKGLPIWFSKASAAFMDLQSVAMVVEAVEDVVSNKTEGRAPALIVIDPITSNFGAGDENSSADMNSFLRHVDTHLRQRYGAVVLITSHIGHAGEGRSQGSRTLRVGVDFVYHVQRAPGKLMAQLSCTKMKYAKEPDPYQLQGRAVVVSAFDEDETTSLVFDVCAAPVVNLHR